MLCPKCSSYNVYIEIDENNLFYYCPKCEKPIKYIKKNADDNFKVSFNAGMVFFKSLCTLGMGRDSSGDVCHLLIDKAKRLGRNFEGLKKAIDFVYKDVSGGGGLNVAESERLKEVSFKVENKNQRLAEELVKFLMEPYIEILDKEGTVDIAKKGLISDLLYDLEGILGEVSKPVIEKARNST